MTDSEEAAGTGTGSRHEELAGNSTANEPTPAQLTAEIAALKAELQSFQDLYDNAPDMFASVSAETKCVLRCNQTLADQLGYSKAEIIGRPVMELYAPDCHDDVKAALIKFTATGVVEDAQLKLQCKDGSKLPVSLNVSSVRDAQGKILYSRSIWRDATMRHANEAAAIELNQSLESDKQVLAGKTRSAEDLFASLFRFAGMGIALVSSEGRVFESNPALQEILGYTGEELAGKSFVEFTHPEDVEKDLGLYQELMQGKRNFYNLDKRYVHASGKIVHGRLTVSLIRDAVEGQQFGIGMVEDVTEQREMEAKLHESQKRFELAVEGAADGIWDYQPDSTSVFASRRLFQMLGIKLNENRAPLAFWCNRLHELDRPVLEQIVGEALVHKKRFSLECRIKHESGTYKWFQIRGGVAVTAENEPVRVIGALSDIALRKKAESTMKSINEKLERRVRERTGALEQVNQELEAFSYSVSHDLRAPLRALDGFSMLLIEDYADSVDDTGKDYLQRIRKAAQTMGNLIDDILRLSRVSRLELKYKDVNLSDIAQSIARSINNNFPERNIEWKVEPNIVAKGDSQLLKILLDNLMGNAVKYSAVRELAIIEFGKEQTPDGERYFVRDNGVGFDQRYAGKLFKAFQRLHNSADYEGTGIGLATVARIVNKHSGKVSAAAEPDKGATFYFTLGI